MSKLGIKIGIDSDFQIVIGIGDQRFGLDDTQAMALAQSTIASIAIRHLTTDLDSQQKADLLSLLDGAIPSRPSFISPENWLLILLCLLPLQHGHGPSDTLSHTIAVEYKKVNPRTFNASYLDLCTHLGSVGASLIPAPPSTH